MTLSDRELNALFAALADPTRRALVARLAKGEATVSELAAPFAMSLPAVSKHLRVLERAGLLEREVRGREHRCRLRGRALREAGAWLAETRRFWEGRLERLAEVLEDEQS